MSYRPITDVWILARPKVKYYGAYPNGFLERALPMIGASDQDEVLHLCGGRAKDYPNRRLVERARTVDADPATEPDYLVDLSGRGTEWLYKVTHPRALDAVPRVAGGWHAVLIDAITSEHPGLALIRLQGYVEHELGGQPWNGHIADPRALWIERERREGEPMAPVVSIEGGSA